MKPSDLFSIHVDRWKAAIPGRKLGDLASAAGVHADTLTRWTKTRAPDPCSPEWRRICAALGLTPTQRRELALAVGLDPEVLAASVLPLHQPPDAIDRVRRARALGGVNPETGAHYRGLAETAAVLRANGWDVEAADRAMRGAP